MKDIAVKNKPVMVGNDVQSGEQGFRIKAGAKAFRILAASLYKNKIRAITRELSCNAIDAQVEAGTQDKPFTIKLPTWLDTTFRIRDYGTGISEEDIYNVYTVLFESTKTNSNAFTGMLGLGSKTPFSYTDTFSVTSYQDGVKKLYSAYMDDGMPKISKVLEDKTTEANGLEVQFAVKQQDIETFQKEAKYVFKSFFDYNPEIIGANFNLDDVKGDFLELDKCLFIDRKEDYSRESEWYVTQGNISYPIDKHKLQSVATNKLSDWNFKRQVTFYIKVPIGTVEFTPSREAIDESEANYKRISDVLNTLDETKLEDLFYKELEYIKDQKQLCEALSGDGLRTKCGIWNYQKAVDYFKAKGFYYSEDYRLPLFDEEMRKLEIENENSKNASGVIRKFFDYTNPPTYKMKVDPNTGKEEYVLDFENKKIEIKAHVGNDLVYYARNKDRIKLFVLDDCPRKVMRTRAYIRNNVHWQTLRFFTRKHEEKKAIQSLIDKFDGCLEVFYASQLPDTGSTKTNVAPKSWFYPYNVCPRLNKQRYLPAPCNSLQDLKIDVDNGEKFLYALFYRDHIIPHKKTCTEDFNFDMLCRDFFNATSKKYKDMKIVYFARAKEESVTKNYPDQALNLVDLAIKHIKSKTSDLFDKVKEAKIRDYQSCSFKSRFDAIYANVTLMKAAGVDTRKIPCHDEIMRCYKLNSANKTNLYQDVIKYGRAFYKMLFTEDEITEIERTSENVLNKIVGVYESTLPFMLYSVEGNAGKTENLKTLLNTGAYKNAKI